MVDHDTRPAGVGRAGPGRGHPATASSTPCGAERCAQITHVSAPTAPTGSPRSWSRTLPERGPLRRPVPCRRVGHRRARRGPPAEPGTRPRRPSSRRRAGTRATGQAKALKHARYALWKNPENLTDRQPRQARLDRQDRPAAAPGLPAEGRAPHRLRLDGAKASRPWTGGSAGPAAAGSPPSSHLQRRIVKHRARSSPPSSTACPTDGSNRSTPRSDSSPGSRSGSTPRSPHRPRHAQPRRPPTHPARPHLTPTSGASRTARPRCPRRVGGFSAGTPAAALGRQQRAGQACPSALTSLKPPHPA